MRLSEVFNSAAVAAQWTESASNRIPYMGTALFPNKKKMGLDLKNIRGHKGIAVSLMPSNFDAKSTLRDREGIKIDEFQMAFFRESMLVKEAEEQEILRVKESNDPYVDEILGRIYDDVNTLLEGAAVVPERMRMQLLCPEDGSPKIHIEAGNKLYAYNYDVDGSYLANNYKAMSESTDKWTDHDNSDPLSDIAEAISAIEESTGSRPERAITSRTTFNHMLANAKIKAAIMTQNPNAQVVLTDVVLKNLIKTLTGVDIMIYSKKFRDEAGEVHNFFQDGFFTLIPAGALGSTWYGVTPEERTLQGTGVADVSIVDGGVAVAVKVTEDPVNTKTTVSEIVLPSYERMDETYVLKVF